MACQEKMKNPSVYSLLSKGLLITLSPFEAGIAKETHEGMRFQKIPVFLVTMLSLAQRKWKRKSFVTAGKTWMNLHSLSFSYSLSFLWANENKSSSKIPMKPKDKDKEIPLEKKYHSTFPSPFLSPHLGNDINSLLLRRPIPTSYPRE